jgi:hypothetical protein
MTNEQINAAIAEVCGWTEIGSCDCGFKISGMPPYRSAHKKHIPDYCADLNEMHDAEKTIYKHHNLWSAYYYHVGAGAQGLHATARKKAEAFLRTLGKWAATEDSSVTGEEVQP